MQALGSCQIEKENQIFKNKLLETNSERKMAFYHQGLAQKQERIQQQLIKEEKEQLEKNKRIQIQQRINEERKKDPKKYKRLMKDDDKKLLIKIKENLKELNNIEKEANFKGFISSLFQYKATRDQKSPI